MIMDLVLRVKARVTLVVLLVFCSFFPSCAMYVCAMPERWLSFRTCDDAPIAPHVIVLLRTTARMVVVQLHVQFRRRHQLTMFSYTRRRDSIRSYALT